VLANWLKLKISNAPAVKRETEEESGKKREKIMSSSPPALAYENSFSSVFIDL